MANNKKITSIYLERELIENAKEIGLNISKVCEIALKNRIKAISSMEVSKMEPRAGFEPAISCSLAPGREIPSRRFGQSKPPGHGQPRPT